MTKEEVKAWARDDLKFSEEEADKLYINDLSGALLIKQTKSDFQSIGFNLGKAQTLVDAIMEKGEFD